MLKIDVRKENQKWVVYINDIFYRSFATESEANEEKGKLEKMLHGMTMTAQCQGEGKVLDFDSGQPWIQKQSRSSFTVHPQTDIYLKIGEIVQVNKNGKVSKIKKIEVER